jgi:hypothetical protein
LKHQEENRMTVEPAHKDTLSMAQRWLELSFVAALGLLFGFFVRHQAANTGFFTEKFGIVEMVCLYTPIILAAAAPLIRAFTGHRNPARPFEAASSLFTALTAVWFLLVFPFNFAHFGDVLPTSVRFILTWINDDIGKIPLILQVILGPISAIVTVWQYIREFTVRRRVA